jgi:hypothetical protein
MDKARPRLRYSDMKKGRLSDNFGICKIDFFVYIEIISIFA